MKGSAGIFIVIPLLFLGASQVGAEEGVRVRAAGIYGSGEPLVYSEAEKNHYLSRGQDYFRAYMLEQVLRYAADNGVPLDMSELQPGASLDMSSWLHQDTRRMNTKLRLLANEDLQQYFKEDATLPIWMELESSFRANDAWKFGALMKAPFNDLITLELNSRLRITETLETRLLWRLKNEGIFYHGMDVGLGWRVEDWRLTWDYGLTEDFQQRQRLSIGRSF